MKEKWFQDGAFELQWLTDWVWTIHFFLPLLTVFLIWVKLGHEIVEGATVVSGAISPDQSSSMEKGQERCEWMELYRKRQSRLRPERVRRARAEEGGMMLRTIEEARELRQGQLPRFAKDEVNLLKKKGTPEQLFPLPLSEYVCWYATKWHEEPL